MCRAVVLDHPKPQPETSITHVVAAESISAADLVFSKSCGRSCSNSIPYLSFTGSLVVAHTAFFSVGTNRTRPVFPHTCSGSRLVSSQNGAAIRGPR